MRQLRLRAVLRRALGVLWVASGPALAAGEPVACPPPLPVVVQATHAPARDRGPLWRATRDGRTSYLYGTLHVGQPTWERLGPRTSAALRASSVLALEVDASDPALAQQLAQASAAQPAPALSGDLRQRLQRALERACLMLVPGEGVAALHPVLQATVLTVLEARWLGMAPEFASEAVLARRARAAGLEMVALESAATQAAALIPADAAEVPALLERSLQQLEERSTRRVLATLAAAWERGDEAALADYERWCECAITPQERALMRRLNDARNPALADAIEARHRQGQRVFAAVGALHMTGPQSLPALLVQRGFQVERVRPRQ